MVNGRKLAADDLVLSAVGLRPRTAVMAAGITVNRGVVTDRFPKTSAACLCDWRRSKRAGVVVCAAADGGSACYQAERRAAVDHAGGNQERRGPVVVSPPPVGVEGQWVWKARIAQHYGLFRDTQGELRGFRPHRRCHGTEKCFWQNSLPSLLA